MLGACRLVDRQHGWMGDVDVIATTARVVVRPWRVADADRFFDMYRRPEVTDWLGARPMVDRDEAVAMINRLTEVRALSLIAAVTTRNWDHQRRAPKLAGDLLILALVQHPGADRLALRRRQPVKHLGDPEFSLGGRQPGRLPSCNSIGATPNRRRARASTSPSPATLDQLVMRDREQPHSRGRSLRSVAASRLQRIGEHLRRQISCDLRDTGPSHEIAHHRPLIAIIETPKRVRI